MSSLLQLTIFSLIFVNFVFIGTQGRFMKHGVMEENTRDIEEESKKVLEHVSTNNNNNNPIDSMEADSVEVISLNRNKPVYRIAIDMQEATENTLMVTSDEQRDEKFNSDVKIVTTTNLPTGDDPEEAEIETTTLFPIEKMEQIGVMDKTRKSTVDPPVTSGSRGHDTIVKRDNVYTTTVPTTTSTTTTTTTTTTTLPPPTSTTIVFSNKTETIIETVTVADDPCPEGSVRQEECNMCICIGGAYFCSKRACTPKNTVDEGDQGGIVTKKRPQEDVVHVNTTQKTTVAPSIVTTQTTTPKPECSGAVTKSIDCNLCVCSPYGRWACTKRACIALTLREKASYSDGSFMNKTETLLENPHIDDDCNEGDSRKWDCNSCVCFMNSWSCTDHKCPSTTPRPKIKFGDTIESCDTENDIKSVECNVCHCTRGIWICSKNDCKKIGHRYALQSRSNIRSKIRKLSPGTSRHSDQY